MEVNIQLCARTGGFANEIVPVWGDQLGAAVVCDILIERRYDRSKICLARFCSRSFGVLAPILCGLRLDQSWGKFDADAENQQHLRCPCILPV